MQSFRAQSRKSSEFFSMGPYGACQEIIEIKAINTDKRKS